MHKFKNISVYIFLYVVTLGIVASVFLLTPQPEQAYEFPVLRTVIIVFASILLWKYFIYMFLSPWHDLWAHLQQRKLSKQSRHYNPRVSVLIPAWNEEVGILSTMQSLIDSSYKNVELVVVNDGSEDGSDKLIRDFVKEYNKQDTGSRQRVDVVYHYQENTGKGGALNKALSLSSGDIIMSIDADCVVDKYAVENIVKRFADPKVMAAVGNVKIGNTKQIIGIVQYLEFLFSFYFKRAESLMNTIYIIGGAAGAFRREIFDKLGPYNETNITEDIELSVRIQDAGMKIVYAHDAVVYTEGASTLKGLMKQRLRWKRGRFETFVQHKHLFFSTRKRHNKLLTLITLPLALFGEVQLFLEILFVIFLYIYSYLINDFSSFISGIVVVSSMFMVQIFFDTKLAKMNKLSKYTFYFLAPVAWLLFYLSTFVEYNALIQSVKGYLKGEELKWQRWQRTGAMD